jgi:acetyl esterase/lipase
MRAILRVRRHTPKRFRAWQPLCLLLLFALTACLPALEPAELKLKSILGEGTPDPIPLWAGKPPRVVEDAPPEVVDENARIRGVSVPTLTPYLPAKGTGATRAIIICAGGGYGAHDWKTHVVYAAHVFNPMGVAVIGLKYRTRPPNGKTNEDIQGIALLDAQRAVRLVRHSAREWGIDPRQIGIAGYSAGGNLAMNLATSFDAGEGGAPDPVERQSCRPDFAVGLATWHWRRKESPFTFRKDSPPVFLVHATNDGIQGGAPIELPRAIEADLKKLGVPVRMAVFDQGAHGVGNLIPQRVQHGFPPAQWPQLLLQWLDELSQNPQSR